jgi:hypothetical protein
MSLHDDFSFFNTVLEPSWLSIFLGLEITPASSQIDARRQDSSAHF